MTDFQAITETAEHVYCVPAALSAITGQTVEQMRRLIRQYTGKPVRAVHDHVYIPALESLGHRATYQRNHERPTLAAWLRQRDPRATYLIKITGHAIALKDSTIVDNHHPRGIPAAEYPHRRARVWKAWLIS